MGRLLIRKVSIGVWKFILEDSEEFLPGDFFLVCILNPSKMPEDLIEIIEFEEEWYRTNLNIFLARGEF